MKKIIAVIAVLVLTAGAALALTGTNSWKYKAATNISDVMGRAMTNGHVYAEHTNYATMRNKWQKFFDIAISNEMDRIYRQQKQRERNAAIAAAVTNVVEDPAGPVGD